MAVYCVAMYKIPHLVGVCRIDPGKAYTLALQKKSYFTFIYPNGMFPDDYIRTVILPMRDEHAY